MKKTVPCHIMVKLLKTSYEAVRAGKHIKHRVSKIRMIADISSFNNAGDINAGRVNLSNKKKSISKEKKNICIYFLNEIEIKMFSDKNIS